VETTVRCIPQFSIPWCRFNLAREVRDFKNEEVGNLSVFKQNERVVKCSWVKLKWEEVKCRQV
jgi:hypothetical protein